MSLVEWCCYAAALPVLYAERALRDAQAAALPWLEGRARRRALGPLRRALGGDGSGALPEGHRVRRTTEVARHD